MAIDSGRIMVGFLFSIGSRFKHRTAHAHWNITGDAELSFRALCGEVTKEANYARSLRNHSLIENIRKEIEGRLTARECATAYSLSLEKPNNSLAGAGRVLAPLRRRLRLGNRRARCDSFFPDRHRQTIHD